MSDFALHPDQRVLPPLLAASVLTRSHVGILAVLIALCISIVRFPAIVTSAFRGSYNLRLSVLVDPSTDAIEVRWDDPKLEPGATITRSLRGGTVPFQFYWQHTQHIPPAWCESRKREFTVQIGKSSSLWDLITLSKPRVGAVFLLGATADGQPLTILNGSTALWKGRSFRAQVAVAGRAVGEFFAYALIAFLTLAPFGLRVFASTGSRITAPRKSLLPALFLTVICCAAGLALNWTVLGRSSAILNILPSFLMLALVWCFSRLMAPVPGSLLAVAWFLLSLRLPITLGEHFLWLHVAALLSCTSVAIWWTTKSLSTGTARAVLLGSVVMALAALTHLGVRSPYSYSAVTPPDQQYLTPVDTEILVNADLPHMVDLHQGYTKANYLVGYSVTLRRFLYEYVWSSIWPSRITWWSGELINLFLWYVAIVASVQIVSFLRLGGPARSAAAVLVGGSYALTAFFGSPFYYFAAYAFSFIVPFMTFKYVVRPTSTQLAVLLTVAACSISTYDAVPVIAGCLGVLLARRKWWAFALLSSLQVAIPVIWGRLVLIPLIGTMGSPSNQLIVTKSIAAWKEALVTLNFAAMLPWLEAGLRSTFAAGFGLGLVIVSFVFCGLILKKRAAIFTNYLFWFFICSVGATIATSALTAPEIHAWSASGVLPRVSYYYGAAILISVATVTARTSRLLGWAIVFALVLPGFFDLFGSRWTTMWFMYGQY